MTTKFPSDCSETLELQVREKVCGRPYRINGWCPTGRGKTLKTQLQWVRGIEQPPCRVQWGTASFPEEFPTRSSFLGLRLCLRFTELSPRSRVGLVSSSADMVCTEPKQRGAPALMCLPRIQEKCIESLLIIKSYGFESKATTSAKLDQSLWTELCQNAFLRRNYVINYFYGMFQC